MSYLVVKSASSATPESYVLTSNIAHPRLAIGGSYIPLSTDTSGAGIKISNDSESYRVMRTSTSSFSQSASASYLTSADSPDGLENVTNLTRISTSNTIYQTRASTSATLTRASTSATLTRASTYETLTRASTYETLTRASTYYIEYQTRESVYATAPATAANTQTTVTVDQYFYISSSSAGYGGREQGNYQRTYHWTGISSYIGYWSIKATNVGLTYTQEGYDRIHAGYPGVYNYNYNTYSCDGTRASSSSWTSKSTADTYGYSWTYSTTQYYATNNLITTGTIYYTQASTYNTIYYTRESVYGYNTRQSIYGYNTRESVSGYATRESVSGYGTRASTSNTVYETRESVSAYSGVSSSSSSESASGTCWK